MVIRCLFYPVPLFTRSLFLLAFVIPEGNLGLLQGAALQGTKTLCEGDKGRTSYFREWTSKQAITKVSFMHVSIMPRKGRHNR